MMNKSQQQTVAFDSNFCLSQTSDRIIFNTKNVIDQSRKYTRIELVSLEMLMSFPNIRIENRSNLLQLVVNGISYNITLPTINYLRIEDLISDINTRLSAVIPIAQTITIALHNPTYLVKFIVNANVTSFSVTDTVLSNNILGFNTKELGFIPVAGQQVQVIAARMYNLNHENYLSMNLVEIGSNQQHINPMVLGAFKLPMLNSFGTTLYYSQSFYSNIIQSNLSYNINTNLSVQFFDRYGYKIDMKNIEFSFSLSFSD